MALRVVAIDWTRTRKSLIKNNRAICSVLMKVSKRTYIGQLPLRVVEQLVDALRKTASKSTEIGIFIQSPTGVYGWQLIWIGKSPKLKRIASLEPFLYQNCKLDKKTNSYKWEKKIGK